MNPSRHARGVFTACVVVMLIALFPLVARAQFDHAHTAWGVLLKKHLVLGEGARTSRVRYAGFLADRAALRAYLDAISAVSETEFKSWSRPGQLAYLLNAYNAFTVEKVLTRYPDLKSIRDFGTVFGNPWKDRFIRLFGGQVSLDHIEHDLMRARGVYDEPRVHFAANCASIGCPMLREEAYVGERLDEQLEDQARRFLSDRARNRLNAEARRLEVSKIFDWYAVDWRSGHRGISPRGVAVVSREQFFAKYADLMADRAEDRALIREARLPLAFLDYDWALNDAHR